MRDATKDNQIYRAFAGQARHRGGWSNFRAGIIPGRHPAISPAGARCRRPLLRPARQRRAGSQAADLPGALGSGGPLVSERIWSSGSRKPTESSATHSRWRRRGSPTPLWSPSRGAWPSATQNPAPPTATSRRHGALLRRRGARSKMIPVRDPGDETRREGVCGDADQWLLSLGLGGDGFGGRGR
jgi:hypothetical protein